MASEAHIHRKLGEVQERVQAGDLKKAMKLISSHIEKCKDPTETCVFLAAKMTILINTNAPADLAAAKTRLEQLIIQELPQFSPLLFSTMQPVWQQIGDVPGFYALVERIHKKNPADSKCAHFLLDLYFQAEDFIKLNGLVKTLAKHSPDPKYPLFSAFLIYMQAKTHSPSAAGLAKLSIAQIFKKHAAAATTPSVGQIELNARILALSKDLPAAVALLNEHAETLEAREANLAQKLQIKLLLKDSRLAEAYNACAIILKDNFINRLEKGGFELIFRYIELALSLLVKISEKQLEIPGEGAAGSFDLFSSPEAASGQVQSIWSNFMNALKTASKFSSQAHNFTYRMNVRKSASLGYIYGLHRSGHAGAIFVPLVEFIIENIETPSMLEDVQPYLHYLSSDECEKLLTRVGSLVAEDKNKIEEKVAAQAETEEAKDGSSSSSFAVQVGYLRKFTNFLRLQSSLGEPMNNLGEILALYRESLSYQGVIKKGEHRVGDDLLLLAVERLVGSGEGLVDDGVLAGLLVAISGMRLSPHNYYLKVQLARLLSNQGFLDLFSELYLKLEIKAVLHESLGYLGQIPYFLNLQFDRFAGGFQKLQKFHNRATSELREVKSKGLDEKNFGAIEHFMEFDAFTKHSYFRLLCTFFQKCITFVRATHKHAKDQRTANIAQVENFALQTSQEMTGFFAQNKNTVFQNRTQDIALVLPKNPKAIPVQQFLKKCPPSLPSKDVELAAVLDSDPLLQFYKFDTRTNFKPGRVNTLNVFETPAFLEFLLKIFKRLVPQESQQSKTEEPLQVELEKLAEEVNRAASEPQNAGIQQQFAWVAKFLSYCLAGANYVGFLEVVKAKKLGMMSPADVEKEMPGIIPEFEKESLRLFTEGAEYLKSSELPAPPKISRGDFVAKLEAEGSSPSEVLEEMLSLRAGVLRRTNLFATVGYTYSTVIMSRMAELSSSVIGKRKKVKNKGPEQQEKDAKLKDLSDKLNEFRAKVVAGHIQMLRGVLEKSLGDETLNLVSDCYVEYMRILQEKGEQSRVAKDFVERGLGTRAGEVETEIRELGRGFMHGWKRARLGLESNLKSWEAKF